jgi:hypothetical protein
LASREGRLRGDRENSVAGDVGSRKIRVEFLDGDIEDFEEDADSFDPEEWLVLDRQPEEGRHAHNWSWKDVPEGAQQFLRRHMELFIYDKMKRYIAFKSAWLGRYSSIRLEWTEHDHLSFLARWSPF